MRGGVRLGSRTSPRWGGSARGWHRLGDARGVDDGGEGVFGGDGVEEVRQGGAVGDVAGGDGDGGAECGELWTSWSAPGASGPLRLVRRRWGAPCSASQRATCAPRSPVPPVMRVVPSGRHPSPPPESAGACRRRRAKTPLSRIATWSSGWPGTSRAASREAARSSTVPGRSIRPPHRSGCSRAATRPSPRSAPVRGGGAGRWRRPRPRPGSGTTAAR